jgi:hypothetical protein
VEVDWEAVDHVEESAHVFANLLKQPYFQRAWIIQEIAVSRNEVVIRGGYSTNCEEFSTSIVIFSLRHSTKITRT